jgi:hypothetical protein
VLIRRIADRLNNKNIPTTDVFIDFGKTFPVGKLGNFGSGEGNTHVIANLLREGNIGIAAEYF